MKKFSKVLAVALAILILMMTSITAFAANDTMILNEVYLIISEEANEDTVFEYTPDVTGRYAFSVFTDGTNATANVTVFDGENIVATAYDDDMDFVMFFNMEAGVTYYIICFSEDDWAAYNVELDLIHDCYLCDYDCDAVCDECGYDYCDHKCHNDGITGFFWSITNFFNRLFRINEVCECGNYHW